MLNSQKRHGVGQACCHHGEILQGAFDHPKGVKTLGLVTAIMDRVGSKASVNICPKMRELEVFPGNKMKALTAAINTLDFYDEAELKGRLSIETLVTEASGFGSSTSDVVASCYAVAAALGKNLTSDQVAKIAVMSESASDPIMYNETVLFAQREGRVIEVLGDSKMRFEILSFTLGSPIETYHHQVPEYSYDELQSFKSLLKMLKTAVKESDVNLIGQVGLLSAKINQRFMPKPDFNEMVNIVESNELPGLQIAHSGNLVGIIFSCQDKDKQDRMLDTKKRLTRLGITDVNRLFISC